MGSGARAASRSWEKAGNLDGVLASRLAHRDPLQTRHLQNSKIRCVLFEPVKFVVISYSGKGKLVRQGRPPGLLGMVTGTCWGRLHAESAQKAFRSNTDARPRSSHLMAWRVTWTVEMFKLPIGNPQWP